MLNGTAGSLEKIDWVNFLPVVWNMSDRDVKCLDLNVTLETSVEEELHPWSLNNMALNQGLNKNSASWCANMGKRNLKRFTPTWRAIGN